MAMPLALERDATTSTQPSYRDLLCCGCLWLLSIVDFKFQEPLLKERGSETG